MSGRSNPKQPKEPTGTGSNPFTLDATGSIVREMPSIDALLNRRRAERAATQTTTPARPANPAAKTPPQAATAPAAGGALEIDLSPASPGSSESDAPVLTSAMHSATSEARTQTGTSDGAGSGVRAIALEEASGGGLQLQSASHLNTSEGNADPSSSITALEPPPIELIDVNGAPAAASAPRAATIALPEAPPPAAAVSMQVQPVKRRKKDTAKLIVWDAATLRGGNDPLAKALTHLIAKGARSALFLAIAPAPAGATTPLFLGTSAFAPGTRTPIWTGVRWDPTVVPEVWNFFVRTGYIELTPPGTSTNIRSNRNVIRAAFGIATSEILLLVRIGQPNACRGVLAVVAEKSLLSEMDAITAMVSKTPKAA